MPNIPAELIVTGKKLSNGNGPFTIIVRRQYPYPDAEVGSVRVEGPGDFSIPISLSGTGYHYFYITETTADGWTTMSYNASFYVYMSSYTSGGNTYYQGSLYYYTAPPVLVNMKTNFSDAALPIFKIIDGDGYDPAASYTFRIDGINVDFSASASVSPNSFGNLPFIYPPIDPSQKVLYQYTVYEDTKQSGCCPSPQSITLFAESDPDGHQHWWTDQNPVFFNSCPSPTQAVLCLEGNKTTAGFENFTMGYPFEFGVFDAYNNQMAYAYTNEAGKIQFNPPLILNEPGDFIFTAREILSSYVVWQVEPASSLLHVHVEVDEHGNLTASTDDKISFHNILDPAVAVFNVNGFKNSTLGEGEHPELLDCEFYLMDGDGNLVASAHSDKWGDIEFNNLSMTGDAGTCQTFYFGEVQRQVPGWRFDTRRFPVEVCLYEENGQLRATVDYPDEWPYFYNEYDPSQNNVLIPIAKKIDGSPNFPPGSTFTFQLDLQNSDGTPINYGTPLTLTLGANESGQIFGTIPIPEWGHAIIGIVREVASSPSGWVVDQPARRIKISQRDDGSLFLDYYEGHPPVFTNTFNPKPVTSGIVRGYKKISGWAGTDLPTFEFALIDEQGNVVGEPIQSSEGEFAFPPQTFGVDDVGCHKYFIVENTANTRGWTGYPDKIPVQHCVYIDPKTGELYANLTYIDGNMAFHNTYSTVSSQPGIQAFKELENYNGPDIPFHFVLRDASGNVVREARSTNGLIDFGTLDLDAPGNYHFTISENDQAIPGWITDNGYVSVDISVADDGLGHLVETVTYTPSHRTFVNTYNPLPADLSISGNKNANAPLTHHIFTIGIIDANGNLVGTSQTDSNGYFTLNFDEENNLQFTQPGTFTYTIREITPSTGGWLTDNTSYPLEVTVSDIGNGQLVATPNPNYFSFTNTFTGVSNEVQISAIKEVANWAGGPVPFTFTLIKPDGSTEEATTDEFGVVTFSPITLSDSIVNTYTIKETGVPPGWQAVGDTTVNVGADWVDGQWVGYVDRVPVFTNTFAPGNTSATIRAQKQMDPPGSPMGIFNFGLFNGQGALIQESSNDEDGQISFTLDYDNIGCHSYTLAELPSNGAVFPVTVCIGLDDEGNLSPTVEYPDGQPLFINSYEPSPYAATITVYKRSQGWDGMVPTFDFNLSDEAGNPVFSAQNEDGQITFPELSFPAPGTYRYYIEEANTDLPGWATDPTKIPVDVIVDADGTSELAFPDGNEIFTNTFTPTPATATIQARKTFVGGDAETLTFTLIGPEGQSWQASNDADGVISFPSLTWTEAGTYFYAIVENSNEDASGGWLANGQSFIAVVQVDEINGQLVPSISYSDDPEFVNVHQDASTVTVNLTATKQFQNTEGFSAYPQFSFYIRNSAGTIVATAQNDGTSITFSDLVFEEEGCFDYTMGESSLVLHPNWTNDGNTVPIQVCVNQVDGKLVTDITPPLGTPAFSNTFLPNGEATLNVTGHKVLENWPGGEIPFNFNIVDGFGNVVASAVNVDGDIDFPPLTFTEPGEYAYTVVEAGPFPTGWNPDGRTFSIIVNVSGIEGRMRAIPTYPNGVPLFFNRFQPSGAVASLQGKKSTSGHPLLENTFTFGAFNEEGDLLATGTNDAEGNITFEPIPFEATGIHQLTVRELTPAGNGWSHDGTSFPAVVAVASDPETGHLMATVDYPNGFPAFSNTFTPNDGVATISVYKELHGWEHAEKSFMFQLMDSSGNVVSMAQSTGGVATFPSIPFSAPGTYPYTVVEAGGPGNGWTTDQRTIHVVVTVEILSNGHLEATVAYPDGTPEFVNQYQAVPATATVIGMKQATNWEGALPEFGFVLFNEAGAPVGYGTNDTSGQISVSVPDLETAGTYHYVLREDGNVMENWIVDPTAFPVDITVTDNLLGQMVATVAYPDGTPVFTNTYGSPEHGPVNPVNPRLCACVKTCGRPLQKAQFCFSVLNEAGESVASAANNSKCKNPYLGKISFPAFSLERPGTYSYTLVQTSSSKGGWCIDKSQLPVIITVTQSTAGLTAHIQYPDGRCFLNQYKGSTGCKCRHCCKGKK
ncbi:MAG: hypothetical protein FWF59_04295 [Turicibacter sp.]|nr:hypothetical protein [Turicibacter sp.]